MARTKKSTKTTGRQSVQPPKKIAEVAEVEEVEDVEKVKEKAAPTNKSKKIADVEEIEIKNKPASTGKLIQKKKTKRVETFATYIHKVLQEVHPDMTISSKAMKVVDDMVNDMFERLANEAGTLAKRCKRPTLTDRDVQFATRFVLPGELAKHAQSDGAKALAKYEASKSTAEDGASSDEDEVDDEESATEEE